MTAATLCAWRCNCCRWYSCALASCAAAQWSEFAFDLTDPPKGKKPQHPEPQWRIPAERMKMREQHIVPLSTQAVAILRELHAITGPDGYLFPSVRSKRAAHERKHDQRGTARRWATRRTK